LQYLGVVLAGIGIGKLLYPDGERSFDMLDLSEERLVAPLSWLGRNSLPVYLGQVPINLAGLSLVL
jgi:uncharacterized membrane protein